MSKKEKTVDTSSDHHSSLQDEDGPAPLHYSNQKLDREPLRSEMIGSINQKQPFPVLRTEDALHHFARRGATPDRSRGESYAENVLLTLNSSPSCPTTSLGPQMCCSMFEVVPFFSLYVSSMFWASTIPNQKILKASKGTKVQPSSCDSTSNISFAPLKNHGPCFALKPLLNGNSCKFPLTLQCHKAFSQVVSWHTSWSQKSGLLQYPKKWHFAHVLEWQ